MNYENSADTQNAEITRANELIEKANQLGSQGEIQKSINLFIKALDIYINLGKFIKISEIFNQLVCYVRNESEILYILEHMREIINTMEYLNIPEELAKLKQILADLHYKNSDFLNAGILYIEVAKLFFEVDPEEYRQASGMILLRAGECFEKIGRLKKAQSAIIDAIKLFDTSIFNYASNFNELIHLTKKKKYEKSIELIREIALYFRNLEIELEEAPEYSNSFRNLKNNVNARLLHMISEFNLLKMLCYRFLGDEEKVLAQAKKSVYDLSNAIEIMKQDIKTNYYCAADLHRLTFDLFMLQIFQEYANHQVEDPIDLVMRGMPKEVKEIIHKMLFFENTVQLLEINLEGIVDIFEDLPLSQILTPFRDFLIKGMA